MSAPIECPACNARKELLAEGGDHEGVMLMQTIARMSRQIEDLGAKYRGALGGGFPVEVNGPAHIVMEIDAYTAMSKNPMGASEAELLANIRRQALETIEYIHALGKGQRPAWHDVAAKVREAK